MARSIRVGERGSAGSRLAEDGVWEGKRRVPGLSEASVEKETTRPHFVPVTAATRVEPQEWGVRECMVVEATHGGSSANAASERAQLLPPLG